MNSKFWLLVVVVLGLLAYRQPVFADEEASSGWTAPAAVQGGGTGWTNWIIDSVQASDNKRASFAGTTQPYAGVNTFSFAFNPVGTFRCDSIKVKVEGYCTEVNGARRAYNVQLLKAGSGAGTVSTDSLPATDLPDSVHTGTGVGILWGTTWSEAEVEASGFGVQVRDANATNHTLYYDQITVNIFWTDVGVKKPIIVVEDE